MCMGPDGIRTFIFFASVAESSPPAQPRFETRFIGERAGCPLQDFGVVMEQSQFRLVSSSVIMKKTVDCKVLTGRCSGMRYYS